MGNCPQTLSKDGPSQLVNSISYFVLFFCSLCPMSIVSYQFCPVSTCAHHVFRTLFSCLSIDSSFYHVIFSDMWLYFRFYFVKVKVEFVSLSAKFDYLINCEWFIIKLCGIGIILLTDLLCGITSYYFSVDLRFDCIFKGKSAYCLCASIAARFYDVSRNV